MIESLPMKRAQLVLTAALAAAAAASNAQAASALVVRAPDGFVDLVHAVSPEVESSFAPAIQEARNGSHILFAIDMSNDARNANMIADVKPGPLPADPENLSEIGAGLGQGTETAVPGSAAKVVSVRVASIGSGKGVRAVIDLTASGAAFRDLVYMLPDGKDTLVLTYTAPRDAYASYEARFDASALATTGLEPPASVASWWNYVVPVLIGAATAAVFAAGLKKKMTRDPAEVGKGGAATHGD
jgi:hypothetical protein